MEPLTVEAQLASLELISQYVEEASQLAQLDNRKGYRLMLAADELVTNIITHGYEETGKTGNINIEAELDDQQLKITFEDDSHPFDPNFYKQPDLTLPFEQRPIGGLGLFLVHQNVDQLHYQRVNDFNRTILMVNRA